jgi:heme-degrading monooxygenase HmoA
MPAGFADTPPPPYYAVIFTSQRTEGDDEGYGIMARAMVTWAASQPGTLGIESARGASGVGITVAYFSDPAAIRAWKENVEHLAAQKLGKERWYAHYQLRVARVERDYSGPAGR